MIRLNCIILKVLYFRLAGASAPSFPLPPPNATTGYHRDCRRIHNAVVPRPKTPATSVSRGPLVSFPLFFSLHLSSTTFHSNRPHVPTHRRRRVYRSSCRRIGFENGRFNVARAIDRHDCTSSSSYKPEGLVSRCRESIVVRPTVRTIRKNHHDTLCAHRSSSSSSSQSV